MKWISVAATITTESNVAGGGSTLRPRKIAAARRASRNSISDKSFENTHHSAASKTNAMTPAAIPAMIAACQLVAGLRASRRRILTTRAVPTFAITQWVLDSLDNHPRTAPPRRRHGLNRHVAAQRLGA